MNQQHIQTHYSGNCDNEAASNHSIIRKGTIGTKKQRCHSPLLPVLTKMSTQSLKSYEDLVDTVDNLNKTGTQNNGDDQFRASWMDDVDSFEDIEEDLAKLYPSGISSSSTTSLTASRPVLLSVDSVPCDGGEVER